MQSLVSPSRRPFVVTQEHRLRETRFSRLGDRVLQLNPWILALLFTVFLLICSAALDWYMLKHRASTLATVEISDVISALVAGALALKVARDRHERRRALRRRLEIIGDMNHH